MLNPSFRMKKGVIYHGRRSKATFPFAALGSSHQKFEVNTLPNLHQPQEATDSTLQNEICSFDEWAKKCCIYSTDFPSRIEQMSNIDFFSMILRSNDSPLSHTNSAIDDDFVFNFFLKISQNPSFVSLSQKVINSIFKNFPSHSSTILSSSFPSPSSTSLSKNLAAPNPVIRSCRNMCYKKMRVICLLLYFPSIYQNNEQLHLAISSIGRSSKQVQNAFTSWLINLPHLLSRIVCGCHALINAFFEKNINLPGKTQIGSHQNFILETLALCFSANEICKYQLPLSAFYNKNVDDRSAGKVILIFPFILGLQTRLKICKTQTREQQIASEVEYMMRGKDGRNDVYIRRSNCFEDFQRQFLKVRPSAFFRRLKIVFAEEVAVDVGGPQKECLRMVTEALIEKTVRLVNKRLFWFKKCQNLNDAKLLGIVVGLAIANDIAIPIRFPRILYLKLLNTKRKPTLKDLQEFDPVVAESLQKIIEMKNKNEDVSQLDMTFEITNDEGENVWLSKDFTTLNNENCETFVNEYVDYEINRRFEAEYESFRAGFMLACPPSYLTLLAAEELDLVVSGAEELDWGALVTVAKYKDGLEATSDEVRWFWEVFWELSSDEKLKFLKFTTGADRAPFGGLGKIRIKFRKGGKHDKLPVAHTCFNMLFLPRYRSREELREKLLLALEYSEGFGVE
ncbi:ubiquitin-protein ligase [Tritrichomonas foetus]|uniref:HECT-type E3 ubiquitin transferase n=1 Tax=Tritrichomonas foetus TaxID=1144522 RepID=A0A1J4KX23_9EUKA|nr:ubiquitin-protein ligase [Tritrichomonas foetus]|eukprot:OHT14101.1 ubiquitin-protein ligase [Tritrichomonas foetus]